jgi:hypothetical protein
MTAIRRGSVRLSSRKFTGSTPAACASSSIIDSFANVFWIRDGERSGPERNARLTMWLVSFAAGTM